MPVDWTQPLQTFGGRPAKLLDRDGWQDIVGSEARRVQVCNFQNPRSDSERESMTTWLADENGRVRSDGQSSDFDIVNVAGALANAA
jgi:hypothetical protein